MLMFCPLASALPTFALEAAQRSQMGCGFAAARAEHEHHATHNDENQRYIDESLAGPALPTRGDLGRGRR